MLPDRATLGTWKTDGLDAAGVALDASGQAVEDSGQAVIRGVNGMDSDGLWSGKGFQAAVVVADKANECANALGGFGQSAALAVRVHGPEIVAARKAVDYLVATIESGQLYVTNNWDVLVRPQKMPAAMANLYAMMASAFQDQLNPKLVALSRADYALGAQIQRSVASAALGIDSPELSDDRNMVTDPFTEQGRERQRERLAEHMVGTIVGEKTVKQNGKTIRTLEMLDGSRQVYTRPDRSTNGDAGTFEYYAPNGKLASITTQHANGSSTTKILRDGREPVIVTTDPDGRSVAHDDGRDFILPQNKFFTHPEITLAGGAISATEVQAAKGLSLMTIAQSENLRVGAKIAGPALGVATTLYDIVNAENAHDACVAGVSGGSATVGGYLLGALGSESPWTAAGGSVLGAWGFGYVGTLIGERVCK